MPDLRALLDEATRLPSEFAIQGTRAHPVTVESTFVRHVDGMKNFCSALLDELDRHHAGAATDPREVEAGR